MRGCSPSKRSSAKVCANNRERLLNNIKFQIKHGLRIGRNLDDKSKLFFLNSDVQFEKEEEEKEEESLNSRYRDKIGKLTVDYIAILHGK